MKIRNVDVTERVLVIAEIGNNHEGDYDVAKRLVREAAASKVDAVKFQTYRTDDFVGCQNLERYNRLKSFELDLDQFARLSELARSLGLLFLSTPLDLPSARGLEPLVDAYKIASGDNNFYPLLAAVACTGKPVIISTGVSGLDQIRETVTFMEACWSFERLPRRLALLHCVSSYPVPDAEANLLSIPFLQTHFDGPVGYSDHTLGIDATLLAVALGARIVEKHFTLDKHFSDFRDHQLSATPGEMADLVERVRRAEQMLGAMEKTVQPCEAPLAGAIRRSVAAAADLPAGQTLEPDNVTWLRPAGGLAPGSEQALMGRVLKRSLRRGEPLTAADLA
jgi:sialic acid synthase SpsE